ALGGRARPLRPGDRAVVGSLGLEPFRVNHSIADAVGLAIHTPLGTVVHSGDFKFDQTPVDGQVADFHRLADLGDRGVLLLLSDSTNAERPGYTPSEWVVGESFDRIFPTAPGRVLVACFASNLPRIQQVFAAARRHGRRVAVVGRSLEKVVEVAQGLGYLEVPADSLVPVEQMDRVPARGVVVLTTGSQGEPMSALTRMAAGEHKRVEIQPTDTVIIAASPVPGNERLVHRTVDNLFRLGARVIQNSVSGVHVSGHASQEELKLMLNLVRPRFFIPVHGQYRHLVSHAALAESLGIPRSNILLGENGTLFQFTARSAAVAGRVPAGNVLVDGLGVGDVGSVVLRDRRQLSSEGLLVVVVVQDKESGGLLSGPDIVSRGFVYVKESEPLLEEAKRLAREVVAEAGAQHQGVRVQAGGPATQAPEWGNLKGRLREVLGRHLFEKTGRRPMILPIVMEV
ncbi:MAG: ribonuclease J, partial [Acetobacteraceae bacterium]|nr:ribonuclease J [Acetobacteraceae bacterium]